MENNNILSYNVYKNLCGGDTMSIRKQVYSPTQSRNDKQSSIPANLYTYKSKSHIKLPRCKYCDPIKLNCKNRSCSNWHKLCSNASECNCYLTNNNL